MLELKNVAKQFGAKQAVRGVSLRVAPGEVYALIGPNGSGKTTIVKMIAGLLRPDGGEIVVGGKDVLADPIAAKAVTGYIPDEPAIWPGMTGWEFLHLTGALYGMPEHDRNERIPGLLDLFSLRGVENASYEDYSRGNKQKFAIIAALLHGPKLLLIDEPIVGLDPVSADIAQDTFRKFAAQGGAVLLVTHTLAVAEQIATTIGVLKTGALVAAGPFAALRDRAGVGPRGKLADVYEKLTAGSQP